MSSHFLFAKSHFPYATILCLLLLCSAQLHSQHVGIGTQDPQHKLDVRSRLDTTLLIQNSGTPGVGISSATRLGIYNIMNDITAGNRLGLRTHIDFPNTLNTFDYTGHSITFGYCGLPSPLGNCLDDSDVYGLKVSIPVFTTLGTLYGIYSDAPGSNSYAGYLKGRAYISDQVGIGIDPSGTSQLYVHNENLLEKGVRIKMSPLTGPLAEALNIDGASTQGDSYGARIVFSTAGDDVFGLSSIVNKYDGSGFSYGINVENISSAGGTKYGVKSEVSGNGGGSMFGVHSVISGNSSFLPSWAVYGRVDPGVSTGTTYAIHGINTNPGASSFAGYFDGKTKVEGTMHIGPSSVSTIPAGYALAVDGKGIFEELRVELSQNWPDYVFDEDYQKLTIAELKDFIQQYGHLPNIPAAGEVEKNGILLGDMDRRLLEKIEELTLYIIEQDDRIKALEARLNGED